MGVSTVRRRWCTDPVAPGSSRPQPPWWHVPSSCQRYQQRSTARRLIVETWASRSLGWLRGRGSSRRPTSAELAGTHDCWRGSSSAAPWYGSGGVPTSSRRSGEQPTRPRATVSGCGLQLASYPTPCSRTRVQRPCGALPIIGAWPDVVHASGTWSGGGRSSSQLCWHGSERSVEAVERDGVLVTPVARTVIDVARTCSFAAGVSAADHALRLSLLSRDELLLEVTSLGSARGSRRAAAVAEFADGRSESVGESLSRARMYELGLEAPELQVAVADSAGLVGRVDFWWDAARLVGEFDGRQKYRVAGIDDRRAIEERLWAEKVREDRLRAYGTRRHALDVGDGPPGQPAARAAGCRRRAPNPSPLTRRAAPAVGVTSRPGRPGPCAHAPPTDRRIAHGCCCPTLRMRRDGPSAARVGLPGRGGVGAARARVDAGFGVVSGPAAWGRSRGCSGWV